MASGEVDLFLTYRTNALQACRERAELGLVELPPALDLAAEYGLTVLRQAPPAGCELALFILGLDGQGCLARHGFAAPGRPLAPL